MSEDYDLRRAVSCPGCTATKHIAVSGSYLGFQVTCSDCFGTKGVAAGFGRTVADAVDAWNACTKVAK